MEVPTLNVVVKDDRLIHSLPGWRVEGSLEGTLQDCSLIVATYQRPGEVLVLLQTVNVLEHRPAEIIVVDGSPGRETEEKLLKFISSENLSFDLIYARCPAGLTRQRNVGIDLSSKTHIFFLDDDCLPQGNYFKEIRRVFDEDKSGKVGAVSGLIINEMNAPLSFRWRVRMALRLVPKIEPGIYHPCGTSVPSNLIAPFSGLRTIDTLWGCTMTFRRSVFDQHRFSEFFSGYAQGEDLEMSLRIRPHWTIFWCGDARVVHNHAPAGRPTSYTKGVMEVRNRHFIWKRHSSKASHLDRLRFWLDIAYLVCLDLVCFCLRPSQTFHLSHALGLIRGAIGSLFAPLLHEEPLTRTRYSLLPDALHSK